MKTFSVTFRKNKSVNIHASFNTPAQAKKWMDEMLKKYKPDKKKLPIDIG